MDVKQLGAAFVDTGLIASDELALVLEENRKHSGQDLTATLVRLGFATEREAAQALAATVDVPFLDLNELTPDPAAVGLIPRPMAVSARVIPIAVQHGELILAMANPQDMHAIDMARFASGVEVSPRVAAAGEIAEAIEQLYTVSDSVDQIIRNVAHNQGIEIVNGGEEEDEEDTLQLKKKSELAPVVRLANSVIFQAVQARASDIHVEPKQHHTAVRNRVDGMLVPSMEFPHWVHASLVSRLKIMSGMDIAERRVPQDGRISLKLESRRIDLRVSTLPTKYGEKVVVRVLDSTLNVLSIRDLGFLPDDLRRVTGMLGEGMLLMAGPTGSGKTTTAYSLLGELVTRGINIISVEDPIEYGMEGMNQVQVNPKTGLTFAKALRSILRQDPDAVFVGEIRDGETAEIAMRAAMTGHILLSSLHTNDAISTISRLVDLGVDGVLVASSLGGVISQRLLRLICSRCREQTEPDVETVGRLTQVLGEGHLSFALYKGRGCAYCQHTGYRGRIGAFEVLRVTGEVRELITRGASEAALREAAGNAGMKLMVEDGLEKVRQGLTTVAELDRVVLMPTTHEPPPAAARCPGCQQPRHAEWRQCPFCGERFHEPPQVVAPATPAATVPSESDDESSAEDVTEVLLVDDDPELLDGLSRFLSRRGIVVRTAANGNEALTSIARDRPHLVITDVVMPEMSGLQLIERLRKNIATAFIPVIILSQKKDIDDQVRGFEVGSDDYLGKPFSPPELLASIRDALKRNERPRGPVDGGAG